MGLSKFDANRCETPARPPFGWKALYNRSPHLGRPILKSEVTISFVLTVNLRETAGTAVVLHRVQLGRAGKRLRHGGVFWDDQRPRRVGELNPRFQPGKVRRDALPTADSRDILG